MNFQPTLAFAQQLDEQDPLKNFRDQFIIPSANEMQKVYFLGNSLGLQPKRTKDKLQTILDDWGKLGVESFPMFQSFICLIPFSIPLDILT